MNQRYQWQRPAWVVLGAILLLAAGARTETLPVKAPAPAATPGTETAAAGVRAFIDPTTGELTANPSPEQLRRMALAPRAALSRSMVGLKPFELDSGGRGVNLQGRFESALRVVRAEDGTFHMTCGDPTHEGTPHSHDAAATNVEAAGTDRTSNRAVQQ